MRLGRSEPNECGCVGRYAVPNVKYPDCQCRNADDEGDRQSLLNAESLVDQKIRLAVVQLMTKKRERESISNLLKTTDFSGFPKSSFEIHT